jgi:glycosyltransferase involved in cell wall biosynthesis
LEGQPLVSIVIPAYNAEKTLKRMLDSVTGQTWQNTQIILVDDGSRDNTLQIAREAAEQDARIQVHTQENRGVSQARNTGMRFCTGKYIRFLDADDTLPPESTEILVNKAEKEASDLVIGGYKECLGTREFRFNLENRDDTMSVTEMLPLLCRKANTYFYGVLWNKLFRRDIIEDMGLAFQDGLTYGEDFAFHVTYLKKAERVSFVKEYLYDYHRSMGSMTFRQAFSCVTHPMRNINTKIRLYHSMRDMYIFRNEYGKYRRKLWLYLFKVGLDK